MNALSRSLALLAVAGHISVTLSDAYAHSAGGHGGGHCSPGKGDPGTGVEGYGLGFSPAPAFSQFSAMTRACGMDLQLPDVSWDPDPIDGVAQLSQQTQNFIQFCGCDMQNCVADALDKYADGLEQALSPPPAPATPGFAPPPPRRLPRAVRELPKIVHEAAAHVRAATTPHAAVEAVRAAVDLIHKTETKTIALIRASDSDANRVATRGADLVADTLQTAASALERADSL